MTDWYAPNQQAVGTEPASGGSVTPAAKTASTPTKVAATSAPYDPAEHTAAEVIAYAQEHPDEAKDILKAEKAGKYRSTVVTALSP